MITNGQCGLGANVQRIRCTVYTSKEGSITAAGSTVREGIIAGKPEWIGKTASLFSEDGNFIGQYEFADTGATKGIKSGTVIDVFCSSDEKCDEWTDTFGDYVYLRFNDEKSNENTGNY